MSQPALPKGKATPDRPIAFRPESEPPLYELYFVGRLLEELALAEECGDAEERAIHLQACRYYRDLLTSP
jgi:hypothetical protein